MRIVVALGGNALLQRGQPQDLETQRANVRIAAQALASILQGNEVIITHGNGPQIGQLAMQAAALAQAAPLDVLGAETDGMIGYLLAQELSNAAHTQRVVTVLTQVAVARDDPAFAIPSKFIGALYQDERELQQLATMHGWTTARDGRGWRRVVASPQPQAVLELEAIRLLADRQFLVVCAGGGGIPVAADHNGRYSGVQCVVDKDATSGLLAEGLEADHFVMLTDVAAVYAGWQTEQARPLGSVHPEELEQMSFPAGSMAPKIEAACRFVRRTAGKASIGALADLPRILAGAAGTTVTRLG
jgi:carbamate kinase